MTGTADTEAFEFSSIYKLDTVVVPTNRPMIRKDMADLVYMTEAEKIQAIIEDIKNVPLPVSRCWWGLSRSKNLKWFPAN